MRIDRVVEEFVLDHPGDGGEVLHDPVRIPAAPDGGEAQLAQDPQDPERAQLALLSPNSVSDLFRDIPGLEVTGVYAHGDSVFVAATDYVESRLYRGVVG